MLADASNSPTCHARTGLVRWWGLALLLLLVLLQTGCVRRRMTIRTNPPGAQVFIDDQEIGTTPCSTPFIYYGTRKITLVKGGYKTQTFYQKFNPPWYQIPPLDFISENLVVRELRDERYVDAQMVPQEIPLESKLRDRAEGLRATAASGQISPLVFANDGSGNRQAGSSDPPPPKIGFPGQGLDQGQPQFYVPQGGN